MAGNVPESNFMPQRGKQRPKLIRCHLPPPPQLPILPEPAHRAFLAIGLQNLSISGTAGCDWLRGVAVFRRLAWRKLSVGTKGRELCVPLRYVAFGLARAGFAIISFSATVPASVRPEKEARKRTRERKSQFGPGRARAPLRIDTGTGTVKGLGACAGFHAGRPVVVSQPPLPSSGTIERACRGELTGWGWGVG